MRAHARHEAEPDGMRGDNRHSQVNHAHLWRRAHSITRLGREADDPRARVVDVDFGIARVHGRERNAAPSAQLDEVLDGEHRDSKHRGMAGEEQDAASRRKCDL